ncbi:hypothetical protein Rsub_12544 [Raphidocelis subcapitata]|uniref:Uncharacterized protein n=1 Tax=Raphidocelis subcapitata TaxID=307507 RepID=A0A2V0PJ57_9CHLO|nr:hypothetical protein Rsub_12544 [Raphidocelis subcapitata]|eukprot:GBF99844.1 hypothetical protein Rsub_12544 [Raphidocelis subcapitata]
MDAMLAPAARQRRPFLSSAEAGLRKVGQGPVAAVCSSSSIEESDGPDLHGSEGSSCPSEAGVDPHPPSLLGPRTAVLHRLSACDGGARLPAAAADAAAVVRAAAGAGSLAAAHRQLVAALQELHGSIVAADHALDEPPAAGAAASPRGAAAAAALAEEARQWLRDAQTYVLHVQAQAAALAAADGANGVDGAWAYLLGDAGRSLGRVARQMAAGGAEGLSYGAVPLRAGTGGRRLVVGACLPYAAFWAKAVAI